MEYLTLDQIRWESGPVGAQGACTTLTEHGIVHGFFGRGVAPPNDRRHARQVHGIDLIDAETAAPNTDADGVFTTRAGITVAVKTADCIPLLLVDRDRQFAVAVHAGWRGLTRGIVARAMALVQSRGISPERLLAAIGPCIGTDKFQVGREVVDALHSPLCGLTAAQAALCTIKDTGDAWRVDLQSAAALVLVNGGMLPRHIGVLRTCTYSHDAWHSARREGPGFGSNWAWLTL